MSDLLDEHDDELAALERAGKRRNAVTVAMIIAAVIALLGVGGVLIGKVMYPGIGEYVEAVLAGEQDVFGDPVYTPEHEVSADELAENVDLREVHAELLTHWLSSLSYDEAGQPSKRTLERFEALQKAVEPDPNLHAIVTELGELMHSEKAADKSDRVLYLTWAWNDYMRQKDQPYHFEANMMLRQRGPMLYTKNYHLAGQVKFGLDDEQYTALLAQRIDNTNVVENYLCRATEADERPLWVVDTSAREAANHVWPMLSADSDATLEPVKQAFAPAIRKEAKEMLSPQALATLESSAFARHQLMATVDAINERDCNKFRFSFKPLVAYDSGRLLRLESKAAMAQHSACPDITPVELRTLIDNSDKLEMRREEIRVALQELTAWIARPRLVHEVRHRADEDRHYARTIPLGCPGCDSLMAPREQAELSGYLAGVAYSGAPAAGLFRACWVNATSSTYHKRAIEPLVTELAKGQNCEQGPVDNLQQRAEKADVELFDRDEPLEPTGAWPKTVEIGEF
jgi:hypothetical protein